MKRPLRELAAFIARREAQAESFVVRALADQLGPSWMVRYLRNPNPQVTNAVLRSAGARIGDRTRVKGSLFFDNVSEDANSTFDFSHLTIGANCYVGDGVAFDLADAVTIGDNVVVSSRASFATHADCQRSELVARHFPRRCAPIVVGDGAWIALGAIVLAGVHIGKESVIAAGSVVREDTKPRTLYAGTPARELRTLSDGELATRRGP